MPAKVSKTTKAVSTTGRAAKNIKSATTLDINDILQDLDIDENDDNCFSKILRKVYESQVFIAKQNDDVLNEIKKNKNRT